jgi:3-oxoacyl-[acyl-carrier-protein] synthase-3
MTLTRDDLTALLLSRLREVRQRLGFGLDLSEDAGGRFADLLDSMGLVEFLALVADDCGVEVTVLERCAGHRFGSIADLAADLHAAGIHPRAASAPAGMTAPDVPGAIPAGWLSAPGVVLPRQEQSAEELNVILGRPPGWLEAHAGIHGRRVWGIENPLEAAARAGQTCLEAVGLLVEEVGALLVTAEAPPLLAGLAAALHHRLDLRPTTVALEVGGACTGFLAALWIGQRLLERVGTVLVLAVEAPSRFLKPGPSPAGEAAALFGDAAAAVVLSADPAGSTAAPLREVILAADGARAHLLQVERSQAGSIEVAMDGPALAGRALHLMAQLVREVTSSHGLEVTDLVGVVAHGGNGRLPVLLARELRLPPERVWSETPHLGNLGSVSLPAAWAAHGLHPKGAIAWTAAGAGLTAAVALTGPEIGTRMNADGHG